MDLIADLPDLNLYNPDTEVLTIFQNMPPAKLGPKAHVTRSLVANGAIINGEAANSIISPGVFIEEGAKVKDSIVFADTIISRGAVVNRCIIDKQVFIGPDCCIGCGDDLTPNNEEPENLKSGITLVGKGAKIPSGVKIGHNCKVACWVERSDFDIDNIPSGGSVNPKNPRRHRM